MDGSTKKAKFDLVVLSFFMIVYVSSYYYLSRRGIDEAKFIDEEVYLFVDVKNNRTELIHIYKPLQIVLRHLHPLAIFKCRLVGNYT